MAEERNNVYQKEQEIDHLTQEMERLQHEFAETCDRLNHLAEENNSLLAMKEEERKHYEQVIDRKDLEIKALREELRYLLEDIKKKDQELREKNTNEASIIEDMECRLQKLMSELHMMQAELSDKDNRIKELESRLDYLISEREDLINKLDLLRAEREENKNRQIEHYHWSSPEYMVDLVLCIDGTASMNRISDSVKALAKDSYLRYYKALQNENPSAVIDEKHFRVKVIVFRDFADDSSVPLEVSPFYNIMDPADAAAFISFIDNIEMKGGTGYSANALEAIATALKTEWVPNGGRFRRQNILVFTNNSALRLKDPDRVISPNYPTGMPDNLETLLSIWETGDQELAPSYAPKCARMVFFAPLYTAEAAIRDNNNIIEWNTFSGVERTWMIPIDEIGEYKQENLDNGMYVLVGDF